MVGVTALDSLSQKLRDDGIDTLVDLLRLRACLQPQYSTYTFLEDGEANAQRLSNQALARQAQAVGAKLQALNVVGERVLLLLPPGLSYISAFFGCLYAGAIAVPVYPPRPNQSLTRLQGIVADAKPAVVLATSALQASFKLRTDSPLGLDAAAWIAIDEMDSDLAAGWQPPALLPDALAILQYTSGSTAQPKGVMVSHGNLLHNLGIIYERFAASSSDRSVTWLPPYHDMGLIGGILQPLYSGTQAILMPPVAFLQRPIRWLQAITNYQATVSGGPNFAYELCLSRISTAAKADLDLSCWSLAFTGAEPIRATTLERFAAAFEPCGFRRETFYPCYGMAEATLMVSGGQRQGLPIYKSFQNEALQRQQAVEVNDSDDTHSILVGCGQIPASQSVLIADPETGHRCSENQIGEIWVSGPSVAQGYWNQSEKTEAAFQARLANEPQAGPFLRTGDLGFMKTGELFVTGRLKDLIIIRGRNHYPQDIELTVEESHEALRPACGAVFAVDIGAEEQLVVVQEIERRYLRNLHVPEIVQVVRQAISVHHDLHVHAILLLKTGSIPKTSSGKIQRHACKQGFQKNTLKVVGDWLENPRYKPGLVQLETDLEVLKRQITEVEAKGNLAGSVAPAPSVSAAQIKTWLKTRLAHHLQVVPAEVDPHCPFSSYGLDSAAAVSLSGELEEWLQQQLSPTLIYDYPTIAQLAQHLGHQSIGQKPLPAVKKTNGYTQPFQQDSIAIVGLGCRFPGADSPAAFWELLRQGRSAIAAAPSDPWRAASAQPAAAQSSNWGGFLSSVDQFDAAFFGITPREAKKIDPQQRWLLEVAWEALEHAGQSPTQLSGSQTGVFVGISGNDYGHQLLAHPSALDAYIGTGNALSIAANRLSYVLNLRGPSLAVDTACSSSLVAVHLACQSLRQGECNLALAAGVNALLSPELTKAFTQTQMMAADGRCKTFDAAADGYVRGEGCGVVVLKRLQAAQAQGDRILAVIRGSAINQDGRSNGLTAPNGPAQQAVIRQALSNAGVAPADIQYVEAHGTGTPLGDPIEVDALQAVLAQGRSPDAPCYLGSVKTNLGHLESAAGIAGLIKGVLALQHQEIPPHLNLNNLNPYITLDQTPFAIATQSQCWTADHPFRLMGVSSFGFGGTNGHIILESGEIRGEGTLPEPSPEQLPKVLPWQVLTLSAKTPLALRELAQRYHAYVSLADDATLADICFTANTGRAHFSQRLAISTASSAQLQDQLMHYLGQQSCAGVIASAAPTEASPKVAFLFTGQGAQAVQMGRQLYDTQPRFRQTLEQCDDILQDELGTSLLSVLYPAGKDTEQIHQTRFTQPALFALEYALADLWQSWGIYPDVVMGHSVGEYVAACIAGAFDLATGLKLIAARGQLMQALPSGRMAVIFAAASRVEAAIAPYFETVSLAAINGPESVVISGASQDIATLLERFNCEGIRTHSLTVSHAFHSPLMAPMLEAFEQVAAQMTFATPQIPWITNLTGQCWPEARVPDADHWVKHVSAPVQFHAGMDTLKQQGCLGLLEIGPAPTLLGMGRRCWPEAEDTLWLPSLKPGQDDWRSLLESLATLYVRGIDVDWASVVQGRDHRRLALPTYPFQRQSFWLPSVPEPLQRTVSATTHPLLGQKLVSALKEIQFESYLSPDAPDFLKQHQVFGAVVLPATAYLEMALAAGAQVLKAKTLTLEEVVIQEALIFDDASPTQTTQTILTPETADTAGVEIFSLKTGDDTSDAETVWISHARCKIKVAADLSSKTALDLVQLQAKCTEAVDVTGYYQALLERGLGYGPDFQAIETLWRAEGQALAKIQLLQGLDAPASEFQLHPVLLDACFQTVGAALNTSSEENTYLPTLIKQIHLRRQPGDHLWCHVQVRKQSKTKGASVDLTLLDEQGDAIADIHQLHLMPVTRERLLGQPQVSWRDWLYEVHWQRQPRDGGALLATQFPAPSAVRDQLAAPIRALFAQPEVLNYSEALGQLEDLSAVYVVQAFHDLGWAFPAGAQLTTAEIMTALQIAAPHQRLVVRLLTLLQEEGWLQLQREHWQVLSPLPVCHPQQQYQTILARHPEATAELTLLNQCGMQLAAVLQGRCNPLEILFPQEDFTLLSQLYQHSPGAQVMNNVVQQAVTSTLEQIPPEQAVRILEIGAGTGSTTAGLLPTLPEHQTDYTFTDVSPLFTTQAKERFAAYPFVRYNTLDIEQAPQQQGFEHQKYHIIVAANVLHATADLQQTLLHVQKLLVPGGRLIFLEGTTRIRWLDLTFGLTEGWWRFTDTTLRPDYPLLTPEQWQTLLAEVGFASSAVLPNASDGTIEPGQQAVLMGEMPSAPVVTTGSWLIFADTRGVAAALAERFQATGDPCIQVHPGEHYREIAPHTFTVDPACPEDFYQLLQGIHPDCLPLHGIVNLWSLDAPTATDLTSAALAEGAALGCGSVLHLVQSLAQSPHRAVPLWLVTEGAVSVGDEALTGLAQSALWGMGRSLALEHPELRGYRIDLDPLVPLFDTVRALYGELTAPSSTSPEDEVALRAQGRYVARLQRHGLSQSAATEVPWRLTMAQRGTLANLQQRPCDRQSPTAGQVEIRVRATGLNFLDVLDALGLLPFDRGWFGAECAGDIVAVGPGVDRLQVGDAVMAIAPGSFSQYVTVPADLVVSKPETLSYEAAATVPVNFLTAYYGLCQIADLAPGDRVLIHAAAGGTGMAAVQLALQVGAEVLATASPEKWATLRAMGVTHVMNSRTLAFADEVMALTEGQGVDCVFNSLAGEFIPKSLSVLADVGRFIEIGKNNIWSAEQVHRLKPRVQYTVVDLFQYCHQDPPAIQALLQTLLRQFRSGALTSLPVKTFPMAAVTDAFRHMQQAKHVGKIVVNQTVESAQGQPLQIHPEGTYLITGGLGGLGLLLAEWLVAQGARHLLLLGRRSPSPEALDQIDALKATGANVQVAAADVTQATQLAQALGQVSTPLRGVIHGAGVLADGTLQQLPWEQFSQVLAPKMLGAWNLHELTREQPLDFFILFSSAAALFGSPGQGNYAAANAFLDALAHHRQAQGLSGLSLNWGAWTDIGAAAQKQAAAQMASRGIGAITPEAGQHTFAPLFAQHGTPQIGVVPVDWPQFLAQWSAPPFFSGFQAQRGTEKVAAEFLQQLQTVPQTMWRSQLTVHLRQEIATVLGFASAAEVDLRLGFFDVGMDSLTSVELKNRLQASLGCSLPTTLLFDHPTGEAVVDYLAETVLGLAPSGSIEAIESADAAPTPQERLAEQVESLSEIELADLLQQELVALEHGRQS